MIQNKTNPSQTICNSNIDKVQSHYGIDLTGYQCYKLSVNPIYSKYEKNDIHYAITAIQKGMKPPTNIGIKRNKKRNFKKKLQNVQKPQDSLNPKSPQQICMKALRKQFLQQISPSTMEDQNQIKRVSNIKGIKIDKQERNKNRKPKFIRKKQKQALRRKQLIQLVRDNRKALIQIFGYQRLRGHKGSKCPKISRHQIKNALQKCKQQKTTKRSFQEFQKKHRDQYNLKQNNKYSQIVINQSDSSISSDQQSGSGLRQKSDSPNPQNV